MAFNQNKFRSAKYVPRIAELKIEPLREFFDEGEEPIFKVRGLSASELAKSNEASDNSEKLKAVIEALTTNNKEKQKTAFRDIFGLGDDTPGEIMKRVRMLLYAAVEPELDEGVVVMLAERHPIEFYQLTNKITELTGQGGMIEGKSPPSGANQESESPVNSESAVEGSSSN
jgi:hypothetical protein